jgi:hypothetical protein
MDHISGLEVMTKKEILRPKSGTERWNIQFVAQLVIEVKSGLENKNFNLLQTATVFFFMSGIMVNQLKLKTGPSLWQYCNSEIEFKVLTYLLTYLLTYYMVQDII